MTSTSKLPKGFKAIAIIAIIWNISGIMSFFMHAFMTPETIATLPKNQQEFMNNTPTWRMLCFAISTFTGLIASVLLLLKKKIAITLFAISFISIMIGNYYDIFMAHYYKGTAFTGLILPFAIVFIGIFLFWYSRKTLK